MFLISNKKARDQRAVALSAVTLILAERHTKRKLSRRDATEYEMDFSIFCSGQWQFGFRAPDGTRVEDVVRTIGRVERAGSEHGVITVKEFLSQLANVRDEYEIDA